VTPQFPQLNMQLREFYLLARIFSPSLFISDIFDSEKLKKKLEILFSEYEVVILSDFVLYYLISSLILIRLFNNDHLIPCHTLKNEKLARLSE
jgi:hypothetical protein